METPDITVFVNLYREAYQRCFNQPLTAPITETESKLFYQHIFESTGLTVGWRSLKNYSFFVFDHTRNENPSIASMDTLARYVLKAPYTSEISRKNDEAHHPYWYMYRNKLLVQTAATKPVVSNRSWLLPAVFLLVIVCGVIIFVPHQGKVTINENFHDLSESYLNEAGWKVLDKDNIYWAKRNQSPGSLTLFTLQGDNWPDGNISSEIKNLLTRPLPDDCFTAELQMQSFVPMAEWQQAGLLLLADTTLNGPSIRVSLAYNDMFGGYNKPKEVLVQAIASPGHNAKPEEFAHWPVMALDSIDSPGMASNLRYTALRIERNDKTYRFLYAGGAASNGAFKEIAVKKIGFIPRYVAIFAIKGRMKATRVSPVIVKNFNLQTFVCE
ncbi:hypothetical protein ACFQZI_03745 [Mucilaginibacter lutimaris]|uniref:Uncharacterized protein n=1 Tax=Mucilaginibacter lutimaris TaxID=931629 RepID=A0ABW2ZB43_9SPHI